MLKLMLVPQTPVGMSCQAVHDHLANVHGPLVMTHPEVSGGFRRYVHHYADPHAPDPLGHRGTLGRYALTVIGFDGFEAFQASIDNDAYRRFVQPDEDNFREMEGSILSIAQEFVLRDGPTNAALRVFHFRASASGLSPQEASRRWRDRLAAGLASTSAAAIPRYVHNLATGPGGQPLPHTMIDEIWIDKIWINDSAPESLNALGQLLRDAETGLFDTAASRSMVAVPKDFLHRPTI